MAGYVSVFWGTGEDEGQFMGVPVSPSGQDPLDIATTLPLLNQDSAGWGSLFSGLRIFSTARSSACRRGREGKLIMLAEQS